jgi:hypothetical protein
MFSTIEFEPSRDNCFLPREKVNPDEKWIKHVHCDGARFHVLAWYFMYDGTVKCKCSEPDCIYNKEKI